ncbi:MAG: flagellar hook-length control protein FliK [Azoarcus sp.]|jgi:hypothetical protein|nr:flagellar hook-length control protein FliK [Azoarcus sp.]
MIPSDLAARLRFLHEASLFETSPPVAGLQRGRELQAQLQDLIPGQRFFATLQRTLPDGTFRALVAGQQVTLALNASAKPGDTLELVATNVSPKAVFTRLATAADAANVGSARPILSTTGQLISFLLTGQPAAKPAVLSNNQPFFQTPPSSPTPAFPSGSAVGNIASAQTAAHAVAQTAASNTASGAPSVGAQLTPLLRQALSQSGLFYESHQAQWLMGKIDLAALLREPQAQPLGQPATGNPASAGSPSAASGTPAPSAQTAPGTANMPGTVSASRIGNAAPASANAAIQALARNESPIPQIREASNPQAESAMRNSPIAERMLPIVHQQLESLASQQYVWHGMAWPGQMFEWLIEDPRDEGHAEGDEHDGQWNTTLRLTLPRLGGVEARVQLGVKGVALRLQADDKATAGKLETHWPELADALASAGVPLTGMVVEHRDEH